MNKYTQLATVAIADALKAVMKDKGITAYEIIKNTGLSKTGVYSVLKMGEFKEKNYTIHSFLTVCRYINIHLELQDLRDRSNFDLLPKNQKPSEN